VEVEGLDLRFLVDWDEVVRRVSASGADVVCVGAMTVEMPRALRVAGIAKEELDAAVVFGGPHPTVCADEVMGFEDVDFVVVGEGEYTVCELVEALEGRRNLQDVKGLVYRDQGRIVHNPRREPISELDALPFPARELFALDEVLSNPVTNFPLPSPSLHLFASRGCPFECKFCQPCLDEIFGRRVRYRSVENVFEEIEYLVERYRIRGFMLEDDTLTVNRGWVERFCEEMVQRGLSEELSWYCHSRADTVDRETVRMLKDAGCISVCFGIESGSQRVLDILRKDTTEQQSWDAIRLCKEVGLVVVANIMVGTPGETLEDLEKTVRLVEGTQPELVFVGITTPTPGTYLFEEAAEEGLIQAEQWTDFDRGKTSGKLKIALEGEVLERVRRRLSIYGFSSRFLGEAHYREACIKRWESFIGIGKPEEILREIKGGW
jgi:radical SAM superfamily enzyme YgiQ (UPF0313 family)